MTQRILCVVALLATCCVVGCKPSPASPTTQICEPLPISANEAAFYSESIDKFQEGGVIGELAMTGDKATLVVREKFYALEFDDRKMIAFMAFSVASQHGKCKSVDLLDSKTNNSVGQYTPAAGLVFNGTP